MLGALEIAEICHEANRVLQRIAGDTVSPAWAEAPAWQRESVVAGVVAHLEFPRTPEESHELWLEHKRRDGWQYGPEKNAALKTHPCCVPYAELPPLQRVKDVLFAGIVASLIRVRVLVHEQREV